MSDTAYDTDFYIWTRAQADALRAKDWKALDLEHLAEEIESLGKRDRRAVESYLEVIVTHLLKWASQPQERPRRGLSWQNSLAHARTRLARLLRDSPSLRHSLETLLADVYPDARRTAARQTGLPLVIFPEACPWSLDQLQDRDFLP